MKLIGATGGSRREFLEVINIASRLKVRVWKKLKLDEFGKALEEFENKEGKIGIVITG